MRRDFSRRGGPRPCHYSPAMAPRNERSYKYREQSRAARHLPPPPTCARANSHPPPAAAPCAPFWPQLRPRAAFRHPSWAAAAAARLCGWCVGPAIQYSCRPSRLETTASPADRRARTPIPHRRAAQLVYSDARSGVNIARGISEMLHADWDGGPWAAGLTRRAAVTVPRSWFYTGYGRCESEPRPTEASARTFRQLFSGRIQLPPTADKLRGLSQLISLPRRSDSCRHCIPVSLNAWHGRHACLLIIRQSAA